MKTTNHRLEVESRSTQEREKRFQRKNQTQSSRSKSNRSDSTSISKFYVKNLKPQSKSKNLEHLLHANLKPRNEQSPKKKGSSGKATDMKCLGVGQAQQFQIQKIELRALRENNQKCKQYAKNQASAIESLTKENNSLRQRVELLQREVSEEKKININLVMKIDELSGVINHKNLMLEYWQKEQPALKKVKTSIFHARVIQFQNERQDLNNKIRELELTIEDMRTATQTPQNPNFMKSSGYISQNQSDRSFGEEHLQTVESELYNARKEIKKLQISQNCQQVKFYKQMESYKAKKEKEYADLKGKFAEFLNKYKETMKKFTTIQIKNMMHKPKKQMSVESLSLSSDEQTNT